MNFSINGYGENAATFQTQGIVCNSHTVKMAENFTAAPCDDGDAFIGQCINTRGEYAAVQLCGYAVFTYSGDAPTAGYNTLSADGSGGIKADENGREYLVINVDTIKKTAGILL